MLKFFVFIVSFLMVFPNFVYGAQFTFFKGSVDSTTLTCSINNFENMRTLEYTLKWLDKNSKLEHKLFDKSAVLNNYQTKFLVEKNYSGTINVYNKKNIIWSYEKSIKYNAPLGKPREDIIKIKNIYRLKSKIYFIEIKRGNYTLAAGRGKCELNQIDPKTIKIAEEKAERKAQKLAEEKAKRDAQIKLQRLADEKAKRDAELEAEKLAQEKVHLEAKEKEKQRQEELEREQRLKAEQEKIKKKAKEAKRKKKAEEEKKRKKKLAQEKARKKKLAEQERNRKLAQEQFNIQIINYKRKATNFYKDIEDFVKSGADIDLVKLSDYFDVKPNPKNKWGKPEVSQYEKLRNFMMSIPQFASFEKERIGERLRKTFAMKDKSILELEKNLSDLNGLMRKMFGSNKFPKIKGMIKDIETTLSNFNQSTANKVLKQSSTYIASKSPKPKSPRKIEKVVSTSDTNWSKLKNNLMIQQQQFCQLTDRFYDNLNKARKSKNEIKVNIVHKERQENLDALIPEGKISNWIFKVIKIDQVEDGSAAVVLGLQCKSYVGSGQTIDIKRGMSKKDKKQWRATIPYNDRRFRELAKLDQGQFIVGSGTMLEINAYKPGQKETFYASQQIGEHPLTKGLNLEGELFITDLSYIAALN